VGKCGKTISKNGPVPFTDLKIQKFEQEKRNRISY